MLSLVIFLAACVVLISASTLAPPPAFYPRLLSPASPLAPLAVFEDRNATHLRLVISSRTAPPPAEAWAPLSVAASAPAADGVDLANGHLLQLPSGALLCAYRHHDNSGPWGARVFRIQVSESTDSGATWHPLATVAEGPTGVWEPFLFRASGDAPGAVRVFYSAELTNGGEQDIVARGSGDGGATWGGDATRVHTAGSRNGMPGVAELADGSLLLVMEGFWGPHGWGAFTVNAARSFDGGASWPQRQLVHSPAAGSNAGSPQVVAVGGGGGACVCYMTSEPPAGGGGAWPGNARLAAVRGAGGNASAPLAWGAPAGVPTLSATALWPSFFSGARVAYQTEEGGAAVADGAACGEAAQ